MEYLVKWETYEADIEEGWEPEVSGKQPLLILWR